MKVNRWMGALIAGLLVSAPVLAEKPDWAGGGKHDRGDDRRERRDDRRDDRHERRDDWRDDRRDDRQDRREDRRDDRRGDSVSLYFNSDMRRVVVDYYGAEARSGRCPPGLAKKHNGCMPPGQAKKWSRGHRLPADVRYGELPRELLLRLPAPPLNHRYVQVAGDVLLIAVGSSMVVDAIEDILR